MSYRVLTKNNHKSFQVKAKIRLLANKMSSAESVESPRRILPVCKKSGHVIIGNNCNSFHSKITNLHHPLTPHPLVTAPERKKKSSFEAFAAGHYATIFVLICIFIDVICCFGEVMLVGVCGGYDPHEEFEKWEHHLEKTETTLSIISKVCLFLLFSHQVLLMIAVGAVKYFSNMFYVTDFGKKSALCPLHI